MASGITPEQAKNGLAGAIYEPQVFSKKEQNQLPPLKKQKLEWGTRVSLEHQWPKSLPTAYEI